MSLVGGSVTVTIASDGLSYTSTGTGLALAMFNVEVALYAQDPTIDPMTSKPYAPPTNPATGLPYAPPLSAADQSALTFALNGQAASKAQTLKSNATSAAAIAKKWTVLAPALVTYITSNAAISLSGAVATVGAGVSLGATPNPNNPATAIVGPGAPVTLPVTGAGTLTLDVRARCYSSGLSLRQKITGCFVRFGPPSRRP